MQGRRDASTFDAVFGQSPIFSHARTDSKGPELDPNSAGMLVLWVLHQVFLELQVSLKLTFLALDFSRTSPDTRLVCAMSYSAMVSVMKHQNMFWYKQSVHSAENFLLSESSFSPTIAFKTFTETTILGPQHHAPKALTTCSICTYR